MPGLPTARATPRTVGSSQEQWGAVRSSGEQWGIGFNELYSMLVACYAARVCMFNKLPVHSVSLRRDF